ncbi:MAG: hypothetical protein AB1500_03255 [Bacillota bacterium]
MVAVGSLGKLWLDLPEDIDSMEALQSAFSKHFNADWKDVMVGADQPFGYHAAYDAYFTVRDLRAVTGMTIDQLLEDKGVKKPLNIVAG